MLSRSGNCLLIGWWPQRIIGWGPRWWHRLWGHLLKSSHNQRGIAPPPPPCTKGAMIEINALPFTCYLLKVAVYYIMFKKKNIWVLSFWSDKKKVTKVKFQWLSGLQTSLFWDFYHLNYKYLMCFLQLGSFVISKHVFLYFILLGNKLHLTGCGLKKHK